MSRSNLLGTLIFFGFIVLSNAVFVISETQRGVLLKFGCLLYTSDAADDP